MVAYVFSFIDRQILALLIGPIKADLHLSDTQFGLLQGLAFSLFYATMGIPIASLADRYPRSLIIVAGVAFWSVATMACGLAGSFSALFLARLGVGAGEAALSPATYSLISDLFPRERLGRAVGVYSMGSFLGAGIAFLVGGSVIGLVSSIGGVAVLGQVIRSWHLVFVIVGLPGVALAGLIALLVRDPRRGAAGAPGVAVPSTLCVLRFLAGQRAIFVPHILGFSLMAASLYAVLGWSPAYLMRSFGLAPADCGLRLGVAALTTGAAGVLASGWFMDRLAMAGRRDAPFLTGIIGAAGALASVAALPFVTSANVATGLLAVTLFFVSTPMAPSTAVMQIAAPPAMRSRVSGIFLFFNSFVGLSLGSAVVGLLNDHVFAAIGFSVTTLVVGASLLAILLLAGGRRPYAALLAAQP
jgi:MFS family permease